MKGQVGFMLTMMGVVAFLVVVGAVALQGRTKSMDPDDEATIYWVVAVVVLVLLGALVGFFFVDR